MNDEQKSTEELVNLLFKSLCRIFPAFRSAWPTQQDYEGAKREWFKAFNSAGLTNIDSIKIGLEKFRILRTPFVPSPGQFIALCKPDRNDLPSLDDAYKESCKNSHPSSDKKWSHQVVYHAYRMTDQFVLSNFPRNQSFPIFERNYDLALGMYEDGKPLKEIPLALQHDSDSSINKEVGFAALQNIKEMLK